MFARKLWLILLVLLVMFTTLSCAKREPIVAPLPTPVPETPIATLPTPEPTPVPEPVSPSELKPAPEPTHVSPPPQLPLPFPSSDVVGKWIPIADVPVAAWSAALLPTGKVLLFQNGSSMVLFDPDNRQFGILFSSYTNLFCAGLCLLADGRVLAVGGHQGKDAEGHFLGVKSAEIFDPWQEQWVRIPDMAGGERWYPTALTLADARVLVASGTHAGKQNETVEILDTEHMEWKVVASQRLPIYPWAAVTSQGEVFFYGPQMRSLVFNPALFTFRPAVMSAQSRHGGAGVLLNVQNGKVLVLGGGNPISRSVEVLLPENKLGKTAASLTYPRHHPNAVLLPDGRVLVVGGHAGGEEEGDKVAEQGEPLPAELFDPELETWQEAARAYYGHGYHSTALLLPDGSVMVAGPGKNLEIYLPWYFFRQRPVLTEIPATVNYGGTFLIQASDVSQVAKVVAIRLSSVTHSLNTDQRYLTLEFTRFNQNLLVQAPSHSALAPPGYYLLFLVTRENVPSTGKIVRIH